VNCSEKKCNHLFLFSYGLGGQLIAHGRKNKKQNKTCTDY
jgi:hypothetical protein